MVSAQGEVELAAVEGRGDGGVFQAATRLDPGVAAARFGALGHREEEIGRLIGWLERGRSVLVVGPRGVGKSALVVAAGARCLGGLPGGIVEVTGATITLGARSSGEGESRLRGLLGAAEAAGAAIYLPDVWNLQALGLGGQGQRGVFDLLRAWMERGRARLVLEARPELVEELRRHPAFFSLFELLVVEELGAPAVLELLARVGAEQGIGLSAEALHQLLSLTRRFLPGEPQPGPARALLAAVIEERKAEGAGAVSGALIEAVFAKRSGLPAFVVSREATRRVSELRAWFEERIVGQVEAIEAIIECIALFKAGLHDPSRPIGAFLFVGPTGVGKTELARALATLLFGGPERLLRFDLSELREDPRFERWLGVTAAPDRPASLLDPLRANPFQVLLFEELDRAPAHALELLGPILDEGLIRLPGRTVVDLRSTIVICCSTVGALEGARGLGFGAGSLAELRRQRTREALEAQLRPELLSRFQQIVVFHPLSLEQLRAVARQELGRALSREAVALRDLVIEVDDGALDLAIERGQDERYGARALPRVLQRQIVLPIALTLLEKKVDPGQLLRVVAAEGKVKVRLLDTESAKEARREPEGPRSPEGRTLSREALVEAVGRLREDWAALSVAVGEEGLRVEREQLLVRRKQTDFWRAADEAARALRDLDRITTTLDRLDRLRARIDTVEEELRGADTRQRLQRVAAAHEQAEAGLQVGWRELVRMGPSGHWDAILDVRPVGPGGQAARDFLVGVYKAWAEAQGHRWEWICEPYSADEPVIAAVRGRFAHGMLRLEAGVHRHQDGGALTSARVRVIPWTDRQGDPGIGLSRALKATGAHGGRLRSRLECAGGLTLQNERSIEDNRLLAHDIGASYADGPAPTDRSVRRYDLATPLISDYLSGERSGRRDTLSPERFHGLLGRRVDCFDAGQDPDLNDATEEVTRAGL
jgi:ATP-dependent Clp protease ATP-binding subunit ClpC